jgi:pimeloyl-ACP methyl ester carboxylesterase
MKRATRWVALSVLSGAGGYVAGSWLAARVLSKRLISAEGLAPARERREELLDSLRRRGAVVHDFRHRGSPCDPVTLAAIFASPVPEAAGRPTILFLHGKGGNSAEWRPEAERALDRGYNVLLPDLRGHGESAGGFITYGLLEKEDLASAIASAGERFGLDPLRIGVHGCSAGATLAIEFAAGRDGVEALWLESPYAEPEEMARHYLSLATGLPAWLLGLTSRFAVRRAAARVRRALDLDSSAGGLETIDPTGSISRVRAPVCLVYGEKDELVPPRFPARLAAALPANSRTWRASDAGHCHHEDEPARVAAQEYDRRWREFFGEHLPVDRERL